MRVETLVAVMPGLSADLAKTLIAGCNQALLVGGMTTVNRSAMFLAQVGHESVSLRYTEEIADGSAYNGRADLGNTHVGDGPRFKGRSFIQITGRSNYTSFSHWAYSKNLVPTVDYFVRNPDDLASPKFAWMGAIWYFTVARPGLNRLADAGDIEGATRAVNGGLNGLTDRTSRWKRCLQLGSAILPQQSLPREVTDVRFVRFPKSLKTPRAIYAWNGSSLTWLTAQEWTAMGGGHVYDIPDHLHSNIYKSPITPGTPDPRK